VARKGKNETEGEPTYPEQEVYTLKDLEQVRVLADPLRIRILEALLQERTTKQVASVIGEKPTKLYHHVESLERVGLIRMTRTKQNRGTLEKYFLAVAKSFRTDTRLFAAARKPGPDADVLQAAAATALDKTAAELRELIARGITDFEANGALAYADVRGSLESMKRIRMKIEKLMDEILEISTKDVEDDVDSTRFRLTLAFFPVDGPDKDKDKKKDKKK
jgi:DNA-binding transcriptional ArsR family regulator